MVVPAVPVGAVLAVGPLTDGTGDAAYPAVNGQFDGLICTAAFARAVRSHTGKLLVCPGIRPAGSTADNHQAPATPTEAAQAGADYIVVGRPIIAAADPVKAACDIMAALRQPPGEA